MIFFVHGVRNTNNKKHNNKIKSVHSFIVLTNSSRESYQYFFNIFIVHIRSMNHLKSMKDNLFNNIILHK